MWTQVECRLPALNVFQSSFLWCESTREKKYQFSFWNLLLQLHLQKTLSLSPTVCKDIMEGKEWGLPLLKTDASISCIHPIPKTRHQTISACPKCIYTATSSGVRRGHTCEGYPGKHNLPLNHTLSLFHLSANKWDRKNRWSWKCMWIEDNQERSLGSL